MEKMSRKLMHGLLATSLIAAAGFMLPAHSCGVDPGARAQMTKVKGPLRFQTITYTRKNSHADRVNYHFYITNMSDKPIWLPAGQFGKSTLDYQQKRKASRPYYTISLRYPGQKWQTYLKPDKGIQADILLMPRKSIMLGSGNFVVSKSGRLDDIRMAKNIPNYSPRAMLQLVKQQPKKIRLELPYRTERNGVFHSTRITVKSHVIVSHKS